MNTSNRNTSIILTISAMLTFIYVSPHLTFAAPTPTPEASDSADIDSETIKENIKKRIEEVIKTQADPTLKKVAITGIISTITTNSFSVETPEGVKQASMSASATTSVDLTSNKEVSLVDVGIGDYVAALGYVADSTKVLDARRILILKTPPAKPVTKTFFGSVTQVDTKKKQINVLNPKSGDQKTFTITTKSDLIQKDAWNHQVDILLKDIPISEHVLVIYEATEGDEKTGTVSTLTLKSTTEIKSKLLPDETSTASPTPKPSATPKTSPKSSPSPKP